MSPLWPLSALLIYVGSTVLVSRALDSVSGQFLFKSILTHCTRVERVLHSLLSSRVLLDIRAQAGDNLGVSHILSELRYNPPSRLGEEEE